MFVLADNLETIHDQERIFVSINGLQNAQEQSIIETSEEEDLQFWANYQRWTFCANCGKLDPRKLLPPFRNRTATPLFTACKCSRDTYQVPTSDDVPLVLRRLTIEDQRQSRGVQLSFAKQSTRSLMKIDATDCWRRTTTSSILPTLHIPNSSACSCVEKDDHSCIRSTLHQDTAE